MAPDSRRSLSIGRLSPPRVSTARLSWLSAMIGTSSSLAMLLMEREMLLISCSRFPPRVVSLPAVINCR